jgi:hypothetical protein
MQLYSGGCIYFSPALLTAWEMKMRDSNARSKEDVDDETRSLLS